jgi:hypothetical protein
MKQLLQKLEGVTNRGYRRHQWSRNFCCLIGLGCPKQAFAKIATPRAYFVGGDLDYPNDKGFPLKP